VTDANSDVPIDALERAVYGRRHDEAGQLLVRLLDGLTGHRRGRFVKDASPTGLSADEESRVLTRVAAAIVCLLADPNMRLSQHGYELLAMYAAQAGSIFELSGFRSSAHIWNLVASVDPNGEYSFTEEALRKAYATASFSSTPLELVKELERLPQGISVPALLGLLANPLVLTDEAEEARRVAVSLGKVFDGYRLSDLLALQLVHAYMLCSYADTEHKHDIKRHMNRALKSWMASKGITSSRGSAERPRREKPVIAVMLEWATASHAMMRCYRGAITSLKERFQIVGVSTEGQIDSATKAIFHDVLVIEPTRSGDVTHIHSAIMKLAPDVVYYPSIGMAHWAVWMSNLRLAPLQLMSLGHPATTHSEEVDFVLLSEGINFDHSRFSERVVVVSGAGVGFELHESHAAQEPTVRENPEALRIAVPAKLFKLSSSFLGACRTIATRSNRPIEFHFFPNEAGATYALSRSYVENALTGIKVSVYPTTDYPTYMRNLAQCDIALGAFAFGNTNGAVDALLRALPIVALDGPEVHHGSEQQVMRPAGLPEWLIAKDIPSYIEAAVRLVNDDGERVRIARSLIGRVEKVLRAELARKSDFADTVWWLFENHEAMKASGQRIWRADERTVEVYVDGGVI